MHISEDSLILVLLKTQIKNIRHVAKINIKSEKITPFGGIYYASKAFYALSLDKVINGTLGVRSSTYNGYQWDEIMSAMSDVFLCGGSYSEDIIRTVDGNCRIFCIRAIHSASMYSRIQDIREWKRVEIDSQETEVASVMSTQFMEDSHYRIVVQRTKEKDSTPDLFGDRYFSCRYAYAHDKNLKILQVL